MQILTPHLDGGISVVVPCYNCANTIIGTLDSVISQTFLPREVICIDDCSTDETAEIINNYFQVNANRRIEFKLLSNSVNLGPASSRNRGIEIATSDWIAFLDADDLWHSRKLEIQSNVVTQYDLPFVATTLACFKNNVFTFAHYDEKHDFLVKRVSYKQLMFKSYFSTISVLVRKNSNLRFLPNRKYSEDMELWLRLAKEFSYLTYIDEKLVAICKPAYGAAGLSANLLAMEGGELSNLARQIRFHPLTAVSAIIFSLLKFLRRFMIVWTRDLKGKILSVFRL